MDKKLAQKILATLQAMQAGKLDQSALPEHVREMIRNAEETGAQVIAIPSDKLDELGLSPDVVQNLLGDGFALEASSVRNSADPRYAIGNAYAKELAEREFELMRLATDPTSAPGNVAIRLQALMYANVNEILDLAKKKAASEPDDKSSGPVLKSMAILQTLGISNVFDALSAGEKRLRWHGVDKGPLSVIQQFYTNLVSVLSIKLGIPMSAVRIITDEMAQVRPLAPLPPEKEFDENFSSNFMRRAIIDDAEINADIDELFDALIAKGFTKLSDIFSKTNGFEELQEKSGLDNRQLALLGILLERIEGVSVEALEATMRLANSSEIERDRKEQAAVQPVIMLDDPVVLAALGQNLVTTLEIAGVLDLHEVTGLRPSEAGKTIAEALQEQQLERIRDLCRFLNTGCDCEPCGEFRKHYVKMNKPVAEALKIKSARVLH